MKKKFKRYLDMGALYWLPGKSLWWADIEYADGTTERKCRWRKNENDEHQLSFSDTSDREAAWVEVDQDISALDSKIRWYETLNWEDYRKRLDDRGWTDRRTAQVENTIIFESQWYGKKLGSILDREPEPDEGEEA